MYNKSDLANAAALKLIEANTAMVSIATTPDMTAPDAYFLENISLQCLIIGYN